MAGFSGTFQEGFRKANDFMLLGPNQAKSESSGINNRIEFTCPYDVARNGSMAWDLNFDAGLSDERRRLRLVGDAGYLTCPLNLLD